MIAWLRHIKEPAGIAMEKASQTLSTRNLLSGLNRKYNPCVGK